MTDLIEKKQTPEKTKSNPVWLILISVGLVGLIVMIGFWMKKSESKSFSIGDNVPEFSLTAFSGETYTLTDLKGKWVLINVWASWCTSCDEESYMLQEVWSEMEAGGDVVFLGVDYVDTETPALEFIELHGMTYPNGPDQGSAISKMLKVQGVPETFLIDPQGVLAAAQIGPFESAAEIREFISRVK